MNDQQLHLRTVLSTHPSQHRPDLDGLRGVAIIAVVAFHVGLGGFDGGFIGVDIFFVLSGYLTAKMLRRQLAEPAGFQWGPYLARRARRLVPAAFVTTFATLVIGSIVLIPNGSVQALARSAIATSLGIPNVYFWRNASDYFAESSDRWPLLHMWSLGVEVQFFVLWPAIGLVSLVLRRSGSRFTRLLGPALLPAIVAASFVATIVVSQHSRSAAFYLVPFRLWELGAGALLAEREVRPWRRVGDRNAAIASVIAASLVVASIAVEQLARPFGTFVPIVAVLATLVLISCGTTAPNSPAPRALSGSRLTAIGRRSYSWYLIHWPLLVLVREWTLSHNTIRDTGVAIAAFGIAAAMYRFVEEPARTRRWRWLNSEVRTAAGVVVSVAIIGAGSALLIRNEATFSAVGLTESQSAAFVERTTARARCTPSDPTVVLGCSSNTDQPRRVVLVGDSHAEPLRNTVADGAGAFGRGLDVLWAPACPFMIGFEGAGDVDTLSSSCTAINTARLAYLTNNASTIDAVVLTARSTGYLRTADGSLSAEAVELWERSFTATLQELDHLGLPTLVVLDNPTFAIDAAACSARGRSDCDIGRNDAEQFRERSVEIERRLASEFSGVEVVDSFDRLCEPTVCEAARGGALLYRDSNHLSFAGAQELRPLIDQGLAGLLQSAP